MKIIKVNRKRITESEALEIVRQWYTNGMYADILQDEWGNDLEEIIERLQNPAEPPAHGSEDAYIRDRFTVNKSDFR